MSKLQEQRKLKNLSQSQLAKLSEVNFRTLQEYESKRKDIDNAKLSTLLKLCKSLDCKLEDILENDDLINSLKEVYEQK